MTVDGTYPGSTRKLRALQQGEPQVTAEGQLRVALGKPVVKIMKGGISTELYTVGQFATALGKSPVTIRLWIRQGHIPRFPYRVPAVLGKDGVERQGRRYITFPMLLAAYEVFRGHGLLEKARIEWNDFPLLPDEIRERWAAIQSRPKS